MTSTLTQDDETQIRDALVGRRVVAAETGTFESGESYADPATGRLTLDDGTHIFVAPNRGGCSCDAGDYELKHLASVDNIITAVRFDVEPIENGDDDYYEAAKSYRIFVFADAAEINLLTIEGDDGNGYYGTGYELIVEQPDTPSL